MKILSEILLRFIPAVICFVLLILFIVPITVKIFNIGNAVGIAISFILMMIFLFREKFLILVRRLWETMGGKIFVSCVSAIFVLSVIFAFLISFFMVRAMTDYPTDSNTTVVILGCKVRNGAPSLMLKRRLDSAYEYLSENPDVNVIVSGGQGADEIISEAECMREYLVSKGISSERIFMEDKSCSTEENMKFSHKIVEENGLPEKITIVTDGYHQLRSEIIARQQGMEAYNISAYTSPHLVPTYWVREWFGTAFYLIFG